MKLRLSVIALAPLLLTGCYDQIHSLTGYTASMQCSKTFVSQQEPQKTFDEDLVPTTQGAALLTRVQILRDEGAVTSKVLKQTDKAVYREGLGCTLIGDAGESALRNRKMPYVAPVPLDPGVPWPYGSMGVNDSQGQDLSELDAFADFHFSDHGDKPIRTSSVAVAYKGELIYERYAPGYAPNTPIYGFSVGKTMAAMTAGVLAKQGRLDMQAPVGLGYWPADDERQAITPHQLLTMTSGLAFDETYTDPVSDANLLFVKDDMGRFAAQKPLEKEPGTHFSYSSGSTQVLSAVLRDRAGGSLEDIYLTLQASLFRPMGVNTAVVQADGAGNLVFGMQDLTSTRDMARIGQFLLQNGNWAGHQILPVNWVDYMTTPVGLPTERGYSYGAGVWLNDDRNGKQFLPSVPDDAFLAMGLRGQYIIVVPSMELVIVRTGNSEDSWELIPEIDQLAAAAIVSVAR